MAKYFVAWTWMKIMDEIHHKETLFNETFQMNLFLVNNYP
jgi:hypothetical protein